MKKWAKRIGWTLLALVVALPLLAIATLPWYVSFIPIPAYTFDLKSNLTPEVKALVTNTTITAETTLSQSRRGGIQAIVTGRLLDWPYRLSVDADYSMLTLSGDVDIDFELPGTAWRVRGSAAVTPLTWRGEVSLPETQLTEKDAVIGSILSRLELKNVSELAFSGAIKFKASAEKTRDMPVPVWKANGSLRKVSASGLLGALPFALEDLSLMARAEGIADRVTIRPLMPRIRRLEAAGVEIGDIYANILATEDSFMITEAGAGVCGGEVKLYSVYLNPKRLSGGFTLFLDDIDADQVMRHLKGFNGEASGRLHGKIPLSLRNGEELRLGKAYLYSTPGETGSLKLVDASPILDNLEAGGVDEATRINLQRALANLIYSVLKLELRRESDDTLALGFKVEGEATHGKTTVPVCFQITLRGDFETLINTGIRLKK